MRRPDVARVLDLGAQPMRMTSHQRPRKGLITLLIAPRFCRPSHWPKGAGSKLCGVLAGKPTILRTLAIGGGEPMLPRPLQAAHRDPRQVKE
jgi:hypothetical protein